MSDIPSPKAKDELSPIAAAFIEHETFLKRFLRRFLSRTHDIEDVVQDTYIRARSAEERQVITSPKSFLFRVARNQAISLLRKKSLRITYYIEELDSLEMLEEDSSVEDQAIASQKLGIFCQSTLEMPPPLSTSVSIGQGLRFIVPGSGFTAWDQFERRGKTRCQGF